MLLRTELPEKYLVVGPEDHNGLVTFWNVDQEAWVSREDASLFDARILTVHLPRGAQYLIDGDSYMQLTPIWRRGL